MRQVQITQDKENLPGLTKECKMFIEQLELPNLFEISHSKQKWKILVKGAVKKANEKEVLGAMEGYKKLKNINIVQDKFGVKHMLTNCLCMKHNWYLNIGRPCPNL